MARAGPRPCLLALLATSLSGLALSCRLSRRLRCGNLQAPVGRTLCGPAHGCDVLPDDYIRQHPRLERRLRRALAAADAVIAQGRFLKDVILELGVAEKRIHVIHNGVDVAAFAVGMPFPIHGHIS